MKLGTILDRRLHEAGNQTGAKKGWETRRRKAAEKSLQPQATTPTTPTSQRKGGPNGTPTTPAPTESDPKAAIDAPTAHTDASTAHTDAPTAPTAPPTDRAEMMVPFEDTIIEILNAARNKYGPDKWAKATKVAVWAKRKAQHSDIVTLNKNYPNAIYDILKKDGVFRMVVAKAQQDESARTALAQSLLKDIKTNGKLAQWYTIQLVADNNYGVIAEKTHSKEEKMKTLGSFTS